MLPISMMRDAWRTVLPAAVAALVGVCIANARAVEPGGPATTQPARPSDEKLKESLLGGESSNKDAAEETIANMAVAAARLTKELDPGEKTQRIQKEIVGGIDRMVQQARQNRPARRSPSATRRRANRRPPGQRPPTPHQDKEKQSASASGQPSAGSPTSAPAAKSSKPGARKEDLARGWGFLPERDREEVSQGFDEDFIEKYREEIIRYYRDLAKAAEKK